jgi:D-isomer specific 2-hydroxyacid dehydrogenase, NAD binding domain
MPRPAAALLQELLQEIARGPIEPRLTDGTARVHSSSKPSLAPRTRPLPATPCLEEGLDHSTISPHSCETATRCSRYASPDTHRFLATPSDSFAGQTQRLVANEALAKNEIEACHPERLTSQVIFVLAPPTIENGALLSRAVLEQIQPAAVLVLVSRAFVVDFDALKELVLAGRFKAAIDVFPNEPLAPDDPIRNATGAVLSAHRAGSVKEGLWEIGAMVIDDMESIVRGLPPQRLQSATPELASRYAGASRT